MTTKLTIIANVHAKAGHEELIKTELLKVSKVAIKADGCTQYDVHQNNEDPAQFFLYET